MAVHALEGKDTLLIAPVSGTATAAANLDTLSSSGVKSDYASFRVFANSETNTNASDMTIGLLESNDTVLTNFATVVANVTLDRTAAAFHRYEVDVRKRKRYLRIATTPGTTTNDPAIVCALGTLTRHKQGPTTATSLAANVTIT